MRQTEFQLGAAECALKQGSSGSNVKVMRVEIPRVAPSHEFQTPFEITFSVFEYDVTEINLGIRV